MVSYSTVISAVMLAGFTSGAMAQNAVFLTPPVAMMASNSVEYIPEIRLAALNSIPGFAARDLPSGGLFTDLVSAAFAYSDDNRAFTIDYLPPESFDPAGALATGAFDLSYPWFLPDCTNLAPLNNADRKICTDFVASRPFYQVSVGMYARQDSIYLDAMSPSDLFGSHICRPEGFIEFDLAQAGLISPNVMLSNPATLAECMSGLISGAYDIVSIDGLRVQNEIIAMGLAGRVREISSLATIQTVHVLSPRNNPNGRAYLALLDKGLRDLHDSGQWFSIVTAHLATLR